MVDVQFKSCYFLVLLARVRLFPHTTWLTIHHNSNILFTLFQSHWHFTTLANFVLLHWTKTRSVFLLILMSVIYPLRRTFCQPIFWCNLRNSFGNLSNIMLWKRYHTFNCSSIVFCQLTSHLFLKSWLWMPNKLNRMLIFGVANESTLMA